jgi:hypothetical protein
MNWLYFLKILDPNLVWIIGSSIVTANSRQNGSNFCPNVVSISNGQSRIFWFWFWTPHARMHFLHYKCFCYVRLIDNFISANTRRMHQMSLDTFVIFRESMALYDIWPIPLDHITHFIAYLSLNGFSPSTICLWTCYFIYSKKGKKGQYKRCSK